MDEPEHILKDQLEDEDTIQCPHCDRLSFKTSWPFCSYCRLFVISADLLDLSPRGEITKWMKEVQIGLLH